MEILLVCRRSADDALTVVHQSYLEMAPTGVTVGYELMVYNIRCLASFRPFNVLIPLLQN